MMKPLIRRLLGRILFVLRLHKVLLGDRAVVVAFHSVNDYSAASDINCTPALFEDYCRFFARYFNVITLEELLQKIRSGKSVAGDLVITFDDGYKDNHDIAAPILANLGLPATFFVTTGFIGSSESSPWDAELSIRSEWMSWDDVTSLAKSGFDIGGHTVSHPSLADITADAADAEIRECKSVLETRLDRAIPHFAYPFGGVDNMSDDRVRQVSDAGFECCMSCHGGTVANDDDVFRLRREPVTTRHMSPYEFGFDCVRASAA